MNNPASLLSRHAAAVATIAATLLLTACAVGPNYTAPNTPQPAEFVAKGLVPGRDGGIDAAWWRQFNDPLLDELVATATAANYDIKVADALLRQARASRREQFFDFFPTVRSSAGKTEATAPPFQQPGLTRAQRESDLYEAAFDATWELDLFGAVRRRNEAARATAQAAESARNAVRLSIVAEVARNYLEMRGAQNQLNVARNNAANQKRSLEVVQTRLTAGRGTALDTSRAQAQYSGTLATIPPLEALVDRAMRRIEVLTGNVPGALAARLSDSRGAVAVPDSVAFASPSELLRRRPDVQAAERTLAAATARVGVAVADLFPRVSLNGRIGLQAPSVGDLDASGNDFSSFGPSLTWAAFDLGRVKQQVNASRAGVDAALATYQQTVLSALEETENALSDYGRERRRLEALRDAARASRQAADLAAQRFEGGVSDFLTVLDADRTLLDAEDRVAASETRAATLLVALYKALGGGWE
jgi:outer membrane protein, multidrug efflux system